MSKEEQLIPKLRFPEFANDGDWVEKKLGNCLMQPPEYGINAPAVPYSDKLPTYLRITDISEEGHFLSNDKVSVDREVTENNYLFEGDIVLARTGASVGKSYRYRNEDGRLVFAGFLIRVKTYPPELNSGFLYQFFSTSQYWKWVGFISARSGQPGINGTEYSSMPISLPPTIKEQQKIALFLSSLDDVIAAHSQKLEFLKAHKKGLMQNLFPQEGEKVPNIRFPEFRCSGEWNDALLGDVVNFSSGGTPSKERPEYWNGTIPWISAASMHTYNIEKSDSNITKLAVAHGAQVAKEGTLLILVRGSMLYNRIPMGIALRDVAFNQDVKALTLVKEMNIRFLLYELMALESQILNAVTATGIGAGKLDTDDLKKFIICFPSADEQQKIVSCLSSLEELIYSQIQKLEQLKAYKKGLMQGLFPKTIE